MRNLIVLSDGTGNGAAKRNKTNVWRLYRALDLHRSDQLAVYDDGVGSQSSTLMKILGGAFGIGLKRNVLELYMFLCRNYQGGDGEGTADRIHLFGFSRGGFTVRMLAGLVDTCGLYTTFKDEAELHAVARRNYRHFQTRFTNGKLAQAWRWLFAKDRGPQSDVMPDIAFIGVWDSVDAYGLPIDELAVIWDWLIFPIRFPDRRLSPKVERAAQVLAIDDERLTFHPLLWDEEGDADPDRIEQVWFAGVHSDVGGGYPMHELSLVSLNWMLTRVEAGEDNPHGLHFVEQQRQDIHRLSDWHGRQHDSRAGLGSLYRYKPRQIAELCNDAEADVSIPRPKIHRSVFERIALDSVPYAPTGLPAVYDVVRSDGKDGRTYETEDQAGSREAAMGAALDVVYWRRWIYAGLLTLFFALLASRFVLPWTAGAQCEGVACTWDPLLQGLIGLLPDIAAGWIEALRQNADFFVAWILALALLLLARMKATEIGARRARQAWSQLKGGSSPPSYRPGLTAALRALARGRLRLVVNWTAAVLVFALLVLIVLLAADRALLHVRGSLGGLCTGSPLALSSPPGRVTYSADNPCMATGLKAKKGQALRFIAGKDTLKDGENIEANADGFLKAADVDRLRFFVPIRRHWDQPWFRLMGRVGADGDETFPLGVGAVTYIPKTDGELFLYVNDAVFGLGWGHYWSAPYWWPQGRNSGTVSVTVEAIERSE